MEIESDKHTFIHILWFPRNGDGRYEFSIYWEGSMLNIHGLLNSENDLIW